MESPGLVPCQAVWNAASGGRPCLETRPSRGHYTQVPSPAENVTNTVEFANSTFRDAVYMLTSADIDSGQYSVRDVVLPTVGTATVLPGNILADK